MTTDDEDTPRQRRQWPPDEALDPATAMCVTCATCGLEWQVHPDLGGYRLRCACGTWLQMPPRRQSPLAALGFAAADRAEQEAQELVPFGETTDDQGRLTMELRRGEETDHPIPTHLPMAPGTVLRGNVATRQRWTNAAFLELGLMMVVFLSPWLLVTLLLEGHARLMALPFTSMLTGVLVMLIAAFSSPYAFTGLRGANWRVVAEAVLVALPVAGLAWLWSDFLLEHLDAEDLLGGMRAELGLGWSLFVIAICPALFEEIAFRGVVQGRFCALLGRFQGIVATGAAFGLCHGMGPGLPFQVGLGIWFCWLRERSGSLLPGMLAHALYNGLLVVTA